MDEGFRFRIFRGLGSSLAGCEIGKFGLEGLKFFNELEMFTFLMENVF